MTPPAAPPPDAAAPGPRPDAVDPGPRPAAAAEPGLRPDAGRGLRRVFVRDLALDAAVGVYAHEQGVRQRLVITLEALVEEGPLDADGVGEDRLARVVDYDGMADAARRVVAAGHVRLLETLAERIAAGVLAADPRVARALVTVEKPGAVPDAACSGVSVERRRTGRRADG